MDLSFQHAQAQRILRQRNLLAAVSLILGGFALLLVFISLSRDREVVLQPVLRSPVTVSSAGVSREYLEMITRDVVVLTLDRSPQNLDYWMNAVLNITAPRVHGKIKADLLKIVEEQRGSSIAQFFTIQSMKLDPAVSTRKLQVISRPSSAAKWSPDSRAPSATTGNILG